jgi:hypothetical protein
MLTLKNSDEFENVSEHLGVAGCWRDLLTRTQPRHEGNSPHFQRCVSKRGAEEACGSRNVIRNTCVRQHNSLGNLGYLYVGGPGDLGTESLQSFDDEEPKVMTCSDYTSRL